MKKILEEKILPAVSRPARYIGTELNSVHKEWNSTDIKVCLAYPDIYEVGMSNLGIQILYNILNNKKETLAERTFAPWPDMEARLREDNLPLFSLESIKPLAEFDLIGFSISHELLYTNILTILDLSRIPARSKDRDHSYPIICAGGPSVFNPEPFADFFDFIFIGEAEEAITEIVDTIRSNKNHKKQELLKKLSEIEGVYVPDFNEKVKKRYLKDLNQNSYPLKPIVPYLNIVHDRATLEIMRGCPRSCRFCQAKYIYSPVRTKNIDILTKQAEEILKRSGFDEISLLSLSSSDYPKIEELARKLADELKKKKISISLPSLRTDTFSLNLVTEILKVRPTGITLAPEAGTQRLRNVINKDLTEEDIINGTSNAFERGADSIKLYFMIGLPTERKEDLEAIAELSRKILYTGREIAKKQGRNPKRIKLTVSLSTFAPKPHTPFQWERQITPEETLGKQKFLKNAIRERAIELRWHDAYASMLEGVFARGDRPLSKVIERAWELGARFDAWSEHFNFKIWEKAFAECGTDPYAYLNERNINEPLPWDFIETGTPKAIIKEEKIKAYAKD